MFFQVFSTDRRTCIVRGEGIDEALWKYLESLPDNTDLPPVLAVLQVGDPTGRGREWGIKTEGLFDLFKRERAKGREKSL